MPDGRRLTHAALAAAGYTRTDRTSPGQWLNHADALYEKTVHAPAGGGGAYRILIFWYDWSRSRPHAPDGWQPGVQFNTRADAAGDPGTCFDVTLHPKGMDVADVEAFFAAVYERMGCRPDTPGAAAGPEDDRYEDRE